jgi:hypothetical protein
MKESGQRIKLKNGDTFIVEILSTQNSTWQGTVVWTKTQQKMAFRSALELIRLIDSAVGTESFNSISFSA